MWLYDWIPTADLSTIRATFLLLLASLLITSLVVCAMYYLVFNRSFFGYQELKHWIGFAIINSLLVLGLSLYFMHNDFGVLATFVWLEGLYNMFLSLILFYLFSFLLKGWSKYAPKIPH